VVTHEQNRLLVKFDADTLDAPLPAVPGQGLLTGIRLADATTIQMDLGPRFSSHRVAPVTSRGAAAVVTVELVASAPATSSAGAPGAAPGAPGAPAAPDPLPVFTRHG
jgi:hypothetical protein